MKTNTRDPGLDTLLDLHGQTLFVDEVGHWVKFIVKRTEATTERPHGLRYSLTLHAPDGARLVGYDNAHPPKPSRAPGARKSRASDHRHHLTRVRPYDYKDAAALIEDFWKTVDEVLRERGSVP